MAIASDICQKVHPSKLLHRESEDVLHCALVTNIKSGKFDLDIGILFMYQIFGLFQTFNLEISEDEITASVTCEAQRRRSSNPFNT